MYVHRYSLSYINMCMCATVCIITPCVHAHKGSRNCYPMHMCVRVTQSVSVLSA